MKRPSQNFPLIFNLQNLSYFFLSLSWCVIVIIMVTRQLFCFLQTVLLSVIVGLILRGHCLVSVQGTGTMQEAIQLAKSGNHAEATSLFRAHTSMFPDDSRGWNNLGVSLMQGGMLNTNRTMGKNALLEAVQSFRRSLAIIFDEQGVSNYNAVRNNLAAHYNIELPLITSDFLAQHHPTEFCDPTNTRPGHQCGWDFGSFPNEVLTQRLHSKCSNFSLKISRKQRQTGLLDLSTLLTARELMHTCGLVVFQRLFTKVCEGKISMCRPNSEQLFSSKIIEVHMLCRK